MREPKFQWKSYFDLPEQDRPLVFDYGMGPVTGSFCGGRFFSAHDARGIDRILVSRWRYADAVELPLKSVA